MLRNVRAEGVLTRPPWIVWAGLAVVLAAAAVLSFDALRALAVAVAIPGHLAWLLPIAVDAGAAVSCATWLGGRTTPDAARFAGRMTWALLAVTVAGNAGQLGMHAHDVVPPWWVAVAVGSIPPAIVGATVHLVVLLVRRRPEVVVEELPAPVPELAPTLPEPEREIVERAAGVPVRLIYKDRPTAVYRMFSLDGVLLYVGITLDLTTRLSTHRRHKAWWPEVAHIDVEMYPTRAEALAVEHELIATDQPVHNTQPGSLTDPLVRAAVVAEDRKGPMSAYTVGVQPADDGPDPEQDEQVPAQPSDDEHFSAVQDLADQLGRRPTRQAVRDLTGVGATRADRLRNAVRTGGLVRTDEPVQPAGVEPERELAEAMT